jgi:HEAT repeat protein
MREGNLDLNALKDMPPWEWPKGAGKTFLDTLRDKQASEEDRLLAAELGGDFTVINDELVDALLAVVRSGDESEALRGAAAIGLGPVLEHADLHGGEDADEDEVPIAEATFHRIQSSLRKLYMDADVPGDVRRRILEASVRAPEDWHPEAIRAAYRSGDEAWKLTAVFCMRFIRGFDEQILESLRSTNADIHYEAVCAAGVWGVQAAWPHITELVKSGRTDKHLLLAAIEAVAGIRPNEAAEVLDDLADSDDEDIVEAVLEATAMADGIADEDDDDDDEEDEEEEDQRRH